MAQNIDLNECGGEDCAPTAITCVHVVEGTANSVVPLPPEEGGDTVLDYICDECWDRCCRRDSDVEDVLRQVCPHCLRRIVKPYVSEVHAIMERLGCHLNDFRAFQTIQGGLRHGLPLCCISFFVLIWSKMATVPEGKVEAEITGHYRQLLDTARDLRTLERGYVRCPACLLEKLGQRGNGATSRRALEVF